MDTSHPGLAPQGKHRGETPEEHSGMNVRAPEPRDVAVKGTPVGRAYYHAESPQLGAHRIYASGEGNVPRPDEGFTPMGHYPSMDAIMEEQGWMRDSNDRYVVFENSRTGEVAMQNEADLGGDWTGGERFDRVTIFRDENAAARYASARQR